MRYACGIAYDGADYCGWQTQPGGLSVQAEVERALSFVANHPLNVICAGRTDAGVHATQQVIHFDSPAERGLGQWLRGVNTKLPPNIKCRWIKLVDDTFHARFSAQARHYLYFCDTSAVRSCFLHKNITAWKRPLDVARMHQAAQYLLGKHDFTSFRARRCQAKTSLRHIKQISVRADHKLIIVHICANAFLYHMVRNIMGVLFQVGELKKTPSSVQDILSSKDRSAAYITAPAAGLYLAGVDYSDEFHLPTKLEYPFFFK
jgi:tRNA pseudouridine38-40 synthase